MTRSSEGVSAVRETEFAMGIRAAREGHGLSLTAAARLAGITKAHLHDMEAGRSRNPCVSTLAGLARAYHLPLGWFAEQAAKSCFPAENGASVAIAQQRASALPATDSQNLQQDQDPTS